MESKEQNSENFNLSPQDLIEEADQILLPRDNETGKSQDPEMRATAANQRLAALESLNSLITLSKCTDNDLAQIADILVAKNKNLSDFGAIIDKAKAILLNSETKFVATFEKLITDSSLPLEIHNQVENQFIIFKGAIIKIKRDRQS